MQVRTLGAIALALAAQAAAVSGKSADAARAAPDQAEFRALYKELVETNTCFRPAAARWPPSAWRPT